ncbi:MAG TPA: M67 family metallopeptidase [Candidatus Eisenbacteria bacterium]|nr:M67 family metallopeptidase [Candidatus Eisenbacteria bacterium]
MTAEARRLGFRLSGSAWTEICRHAEEAFPEECCGIIVSDGASDQVRPLKNIQNLLHALDPETYPRTAAIAYAMDPQELERTINEAERQGSRLVAFYHSHPQHEAYFSEEDKAFASPFGEPTFPGAAQLVISVYDRRVKRLAAFLWSEQAKDFVEIPLERV